MMVVIVAVRQPADIVHEQDIDTTDFESLETTFDRTHDAVIGIVVNDVVGHRVDKPVAFCRRLGGLQ